MSLSEEMDKEKRSAKNVVTCPLCAGSRLSVLYERLADRWFGSPGEWDLDECSECNLVFLNPSPTAEQLDRAYAGYFTHKAPNNADGKIIEKSQFWPVVTAKKMYRWAIGAVDRKRIEMKNMYASSPSPGLLLDIGCGNGLFLKHMSDQGWAVQGVEPDPHSAKIARETYGFEIFTGTLTDAGFPPDHFDCITMSHVIEHLRNPLEVLAECLRVLKPGGTLVVTTPNIKSLGHRFFRKKWLGLDPPRHLLLFSPKNLGILASKAGFVKPQLFTSALRADAMFNDMVRVQTGRFHGNLKRGWYSLSQLFLLVEYAAVSLLPDAGEEIVLKARK